MNTDLTTKASPMGRPGHSFLILSASMITLLILLINLSFKIIAIPSLVFTTSSVLCPLAALIYLLVLTTCNWEQQRHFLNQALIALYLFSIGVFLLVNLPAAEYMHNNPAYQIVFEDIPKKFFASTIAFGFSFYLPHLFCYSKKPHLLASFNKCLMFASLGGFFFFFLDFILLFSIPFDTHFRRIYFDSVLITLILLFISGIICFFLNSCTQWLKKTLKRSSSLYLASPLYHYLVNFSVIILLICSACEYRLVSFSDDWILTASGVLFPLTMMISSLVGELYGYRANLCLIIVLTLTSLAFDLLLMGAVALPSPEFFNLNPYYTIILPQRVPAITMTMFVTYLSNATLLEHLKMTPFAPYRGLRILIANIFSISLLSITHYNPLFGGIYPYEQIFNLAINAWIYKVIATFVCLPFILKLYQRWRQTSTPNDHREEIV